MCKEKKKHVYREICTHDALPLSSDALTSFSPNYRLLEIDISSNKLSHLPPGLLHLSKLQKLTASKNYLEKLFEEENGIFSINNLTYFVIFFLIGLFLQFILFHFPLATNWIGLRKLQELDISDNKLTELPALFLHSFKSLSCLNVSRNNVKVFPNAWACPLVSNLPKIMKGAVSPHPCQPHRAVGAVHTASPWRPRGGVLCYRQACYSASSS